MRLLQEMEFCSRAPRRVACGIAVACARVFLVALAWFPPTGAAAAEDTAPARTYVGTQLCSACHRDVASHWAHTVHSRVFINNPRTELEGRGCEACHGPGSQHIADPKIPGGILRFTHDSPAPVAERNQACLLCHQGGDRIHWAGSAHDSGDIACSDCHNPMANVSPARLLARESINETCFSCHKEQRSRFNRRSHMPLDEGKLVCTDCHNPHGSTTVALLKTDSANDVCFQCHAEKRGPFLFEHAPVREGCTNCHEPHGSNHEKLLVSAPPMLCQHCHTARGHPNTLLTQQDLADGVRPDARVMARGCVNCHAQIHGSNHPGGARFTR